MLVRFLLGLCLVLVSSNSLATPATSPRVPILPDVITSQLGPVDVVAAVDLSKLDLHKLTAAIPGKLACLRDLVASAHIGVFASGDHAHGIVTGLSETATRACLASVAPALGFTMADGAEGALELQIPGNPVALAWHGDLLVVTQAGHPSSSGNPPAALLELVSHVPRDAKAWMASTGFDKKKIKSVVAWITTPPDHWIVTVMAEGLEPDVARKWVESFAGGAKSAATAKGIKLDDSWFKVESTKTSARLVATIPSEILRR
jgi:hypothetical protein